MDGTFIYRRCSPAGMPIGKEGKLRQMRVHLPSLHCPIKNKVNDVYLMLCLSSHEEASGPDSGMQRQRKKGQGSEPLNAPARTGDGPTGTASGGSAFWVRTSPSKCSICFAP